MIDLRPVRHRVERAERPLERGDVVAVAAADVPAERAELGLDVAEVADVVAPRCPTESCCDRRSRRSRRGRGWPPSRATPRTALPAARRRRSARRCGAACRPAGWPAPCPSPSRCPCPSEPVFAWMYGVSTCGWPGQPVQPAQLVQLVGGQQAEADEHRVERRRVVPLRREEDVAAVRALVEIAHLVEEQPAHDLERAEAGADVARTTRRRSCTAC